MKKVILKPSESVIAVVPEIATSPECIRGVVCVHIVDTVTNKWRYEHIKSDEQTPEMRVLFDVGARLTRQLIANVPTQVAKS